MGLFSFLNQEIAIDLGTANTLIIESDKVVVDEPSIIAKHRTSGDVMAIGKELCKCMERLMRKSKQFVR